MGQKVYCKNLQQINPDLKAINKHLVRVSIYSIISIDNKMHTHTLVTGKMRQKSARWYHCPNTVLSNTIKLPKKFIYYKIYPRKHSLLENKIHYKYCTPNPLKSLRFS